MSTTARELPVGIFNSGTVRFLELFHTLRREDSTGKVGSVPDGGRHVTVLLIARRVGSRSRGGRSGQDPGDLDGKVMAQMDDSSGEGESLFLVALLEVIDLSLDLVDRQGVGWGRVGNHVVHDEREVKVALGEIGSWGLEGGSVVELYTRKERLAGRCEHVRGGREQDGRGRRMKESVRCVLLKGPLAHKRSEEGIRLYE